MALYIDNNNNTNVRFLYHGLGQVRALIKAAEKDEIGAYAQGAMDKVMAASVETFKAMDDANSTWVNCSGAKSPERSLARITARSTVTLVRVSCRCLFVWFRALWTHVLY